MTDNYNKLPELFGEPRPHVTGTHFPTAFDDDVEFINDEMRDLRIWEMKQLQRAMVEHRIAMAAQKRKQ